jgi:hypothetical protein
VEAVVVESTYPLGIGDIIFVRKYEYDINPSRICRVIREITQQEYKEISKIENATYYDSVVKYYNEDRSYNYYYEVSVED